VVEILQGYGKIVFSEIGKLIPELIGRDGKWIANTAGKSMIG
jgi:hypothetical protein